MRGQRVAERYRLDVQIGSGGMGVVWRATDEELGRVVAVKRAHLPGGVRNEQEMRREARMAAGVHHPNVVTLFDLVADGDERWLVMEYVPARSLAELIADRGPIPARDAAAIGAQLAAALGAVHANGLLHRDIKPGNVLVTEDGTAKLTDFGVSRVGWGELTMVDTATVAGTPAYLAPEVADGDEPTAASDVFALGATLYAAVEGTSPFGTAANPLAMLRRAAAGEVIEPRAAGVLAPVLAAVLRRDPTQRPDPGWLRETLGNIAATGTDDTVAVAPPRRAHPPRRRWLPVAAGVVLLIAVVAVLFAVLPGDRPAARQASEDTRMLRLGDPHTVDPCKLIDPVALGRLGGVMVDPDIGGFGRCDALITIGTDDVDARVELIGPQDELNQLNGAGRRVGALRVLSEDPQRNECERYVLLPDGNLVDVFVDQQTYLTDMCRVADTVTDHVLRTLGDGGLPRRRVPLAVNSLARVNACTLLDRHALSLVPGNDAALTERGFGGWDCTWESDGSDTRVKLSFDQDGDFSAEHYGRPARLDGRPAFVQPNDDNEHNCAVRVRGRKYVDVAGENTYELLVVTVTGPQPNTRLCAAAGELGAAAARRMPPQ